MEDHPGRLRGRSRLAGGPLGPADSLRPGHSRVAAGRAGAARERPV